jgi:hypothetical protein
MLAIVFVVALDLATQAHDDLCDLVDVTELLDHIVATALGLPIGLGDVAVVLISLCSD